jgi:hypothetical protein
MKTRAALSLAVAGVFVTGSAALAVNTQVLNTTPAGTGNANSILLPNDSGGSASPGVVASAKATPDVASAAGSGTAPATRKTAVPPETWDRNDDDNGGRQKAPLSVPGDGKGGTVTEKNDGGPAGSQPAAGGSVVVVQPEDDKGGLRTVPEPGDDKGGQRKAAEPDDDSGGHGSDD